MHDGETATRVREGGKERETRRQEMEAKKEYALGKKNREGSTKHFL